ncbi:GNAT family N-acetyltransferase [Oculatella sp. LEGE 06141]|uniref:GNAT family N-acetyltransferase n=1 Tax=Oculatella sp. LEGE 06141 TaxID=1828648 RepID=UPI0018828916|nr:GNAT family N-acetyltransferase [Oculatella sp. LEGE 06141]MBE9178224.1 GNAT family N-acetyltransferase [Oculatella sp. LEGE 06141]
MSTSGTDVFASPSPAWDLTHRSFGELPFLIRTVRQQDLQRLTDVLAASFHHRDGLMGWLYPLFRMGIYEDLRSRLQKKMPHHACLVAIAAASANRSPMPTQAVNNLAGTIEISLRSQHLWQPHHSRHLYLSNLAVQSDYRRQGVAQQLLKTCERIALEWGHQDLYLHVLENNYKARRLYMKAGYRLQRIDSTMSSMVLGQPRQLFLHKRLQG